MEENKEKNKLRHGKRERQSKRICETSHSVGIQYIAIYTLNFFQRYKILSAILLR